MDSRTKKNIESLHPNAQDWARAHLAAIEASGKIPKGYAVKIISGNRTWAEQDELYAQGRTKPGNVVTNARGGQSNHNFGIAWDLGIFDAKGNYLGNSPLYSEIASVGAELGLDCGAYWKSFKDLPHYGVKTGLSTSGLRARVLQGKEIPVPPYGGSALPPPSDKVEVYDGEALTPIEAFLDDGRVWVAVRLFVHHFGGEVLDVNGTNFSVELHDEKVTVPGTIRDGIGFAKFADLNRVLDWGFRFEAGRLTILTGAK
ncbi:MAG: M15 family metallopeptidase [Pyrinomonadaceae bacterium]